MDRKKSLDKKPAGGLAQCRKSCGHDLLSIVWTAVLADGADATAGNARDGPVAKSVAYS